MHKFVTPIILIITSALCGTAVAGEDSCQPLRDQSARACRAQSDKWSAILAGTACMLSVKAIHDCEAQQAQLSQPIDEQAPAPAKEDDEDSESQE